MFSPLMILTLITSSGISSLLWNLYSKKYTGADNDNEKESDERFFIKFLIFFFAFIIFYSIIFILIINLWGLISNYR